MTDNIAETVIKELVDTVVNDNLLNTDSQLVNDHSISLDDTEESMDEHKAPDLIANIYQSMSKIIEALNTDNLLLNRQVDKIRKELEFVCDTLTKLKSNQEEMSVIYASEVGQIKDIDIVELRKKINSISEIQKHVMETRNMLMQTLDANIKTIKKELSELRNEKPLVRSVIEEEVDAYLRRNPVTSIIEQQIEANIKKSMLSAISDMLK